MSIKYVESAHKQWLGREFSEPVLPKTHLLLLLLTCCLVLVRFALAAWSLCPVNMTSRSSYTPAAPRHAWSVAVTSHFYDLEEPWMLYCDDHKRGLKSTEPASKEIVCVCHAHTKCTVGLLLRNLQFCPFFSWQAFNLISLGAQKDLRFFPRLRHNQLCKRNLDILPKRCVCPPMTPLAHLSRGVYQSPGQEP